MFLWKYLFLSLLFQIPVVLSSDEKYLVNNIPEDGIPLHLLSDSKARCMDGSQAGYYIRPGSDVNSTRFVINLQGGGECADEKSCKAKLKTSLGSSNYFPRTVSSFGQYQDFDCNHNELLCGWTMVYIPYCSQDLHSGQIANPSPATWGLYFSGAFIVQTVLAELTRHFELSKATEVVLSGQSAGGIGIWYHLDMLSELLPNARVVGAPIAGFYFPAYPYEGINHTTSTLADFRPQAWPGHFTLWNSSVDASCKLAFQSKPWLCMLANVSYDYISTPVFISEAQTDQVVILAHDSIPPTYVRAPPEMRYIEKWKENMTQALQRPALSKRDGVFSPACFIHTDFSWSQPTIKGYSFITAFNIWFTTRCAVNLQDTCGVMCNPTCPSFTWLKRYL
eukprot:gene6562-7514_t